MVRWCRVWFLSRKMLGSSPCVFALRARWGRYCQTHFKVQFGNLVISSISGLVAEYIVAIDVTRVRFPADAFFLHIASSLAPWFLNRPELVLSTVEYCECCVPHCLSVYLVWGKTRASERESFQDIHSSATICAFFGSAGGEPFSSRPSPARSTLPISYYEPEPCLLA